MFKYKISKVSARPAAEVKGQIRLKMKDLLCQHLGRREFSVVAKLLLEAQRRKSVPKITQISQKKHQIGLKYANLNGLTQDY